MVLFTMALATYVYCIVTSINTLTIMLTQRATSLPVAPPVIGYPLSALLLHIKLNKTTSSLILAPAITCVTTGDIQATATSNTDLTTSLGHQFQLQDALYTPKLPMNLVSISSLEDAHVNTHFGKRGVQFHWRSKLVAMGSRLPATCSTKPSALVATLPLMTLHHQFGHTAITVLCNLAAAGTLSDLIWLYTMAKCDSFSCDTCSASKAHVLPFPRSSSQSQHVLDLVHSNVLSFPLPSLSGKTYLVTFIDNHLCKVWGYPIAKKSDVFHMFRTWQQSIERETGRQIKSHCQDRGIQREWTIPYTLQQNSWAECANLSIVEGVLALLHDLGLGPAFWVEAYHYYICTKNLSPHSVLDGDAPGCHWCASYMPPGFELHSTDLRVFGYCTWVTTPSHKRNKLEPKARPYIFLARDNVTPVVPPPSTIDVPMPKPAPQPPVVTLCNQFAVLNVEKPFDDGDAGDIPHKPATPPRAPSPAAPSSPDFWVEVPVVKRKHRALVATADKGEDRTVAEATINYIEHSSALLADAHPEAPLKLSLANADPQTHQFLSLRDEYDCFTVIDGKEVPTGATIVGARYKAQLVAQGFTQKPGVDFNESFAPVAKFTLICTIISITTAWGYHIHQADIDKAYLHGKLEEDIYMRVPDGINLPGKVLKLNQSIYRLKQAGRVWNERIDVSLNMLGYHATKLDHCVYVREEANKLHYIALYVDDLIMASPNLSEIERILTGLEREYSIKHLGPAKYILGIQLKRKSNRSITISQEAYINDVLKRFDMIECNPTSTPMAPNLKLEPSLTEPTALEKTHYLQAIGSLLYASLGTQPDIIYAVTYLAHFSSCPGPAHWTAIKTVLCYLKGTTAMGLTYLRTPAPLHGFSGYSDSDWGACVLTSRSTMGFSFHLAGAAVSWSSKVQNRVANSSTDAEYIGLLHAGKEAVFLRQLLAELGIPITSPTLICGDNQGANVLTKSPQFHQCTRHICLREHFIWDMVRLGNITVQYILMQDMTADIFTKTLGHELFCGHCQHLGLHFPSASNEGGC
ncbi:BQ2448_196 [Microbotryum intermedium]|uniref:BQ2448_196 protein n=1 Tax=Microbotryum intermedium TaxID=269621 RepID=A0A238F4V5_9BASI|nr:BQ2448_196 [Microbotryum intermedium]